MAFTEDLDVFFDTDAFAVEATYRAGGSGPLVTKAVIFDRAHLETLGISDANPVALGKATDFATADSTDTLAINGTTYRISDIQPQDDGATVLLQLRSTS